MTATLTAVDVTTGTPLAAPDESRRGAAMQSMGRVARSVGGAVFSLALIVVIWDAALRLFDLNNFVAKSPLDVWRYLVTDGDGPAGSAGDHWDLLLPDLRLTFVHAVIGFVVGMGVAFVAALTFVLYRPVEQTFLPVAVLLRSVPLIAMTPVLRLIFGTGFVAVTVITGIVVFFPALVTIAFGLRSTSAQAQDLCRAYGAGRLTVARKVMIPSALPAVFAAARVSVPGALIGALVAEWLVTHNGVGYAILVAAANTFKYSYLWSAVVLVTVASVVAYFVVAALEGVVLARYGPSAGQR